MEIINTIKKMKSIVGEHKKNGATIGFVPTMGYLHKGHTSLIERARKENDIVVVSIFVNPTQFGPNEDYEVYPRDMERDKALSAEAGADYIFYPDAKEMYPFGYQTYVEVAGITEKLCGASRPGHFKGVTTVVNKLFQIVSPSNAYFGLKDAQQVAVIQQMTEDLFMDVTILPCPIVREEDGLAMSSRNVYLKDDERRAALTLSKSLFMAKEKIYNGERATHEIIKLIKEEIDGEPLLKIDYIEAVGFPKLNSIDVIDGRVLIALAVKVGKVRLIDNIIVEA